MIFLIISLFFLLKQSISFPTNANLPLISHRLESVRLCLLILDFFLKSRISHTLLLSLYNFSSTPAHYTSLTYDNLNGWGIVVISCLAFEYRFSIWKTFSSRSFFSCWSFFARSLFCRYFSMPETAAGSFSTANSEGISPLISGLNVHSLSSLYSSNLEKVLIFCNHCHYYFFSCCISSSFFFWAILMLSSTFWSVL